MNVFISGVSSGLGHGLADVYLDQGYTVYGLSRRTPSDLIDHPCFHFLALDLAELSSAPGQLSSFFESVTSFQIVYLNAGVLGLVRDLKDSPVEELRIQMDINVWSNKIILDVLRDTGIQVEQVLTISSGAAVNGSRGWNGYSISKAALNMFTKLYAQEWPETHFTAFAPGLIDTAMQDYLCDEVDTAQYPSIQKLLDARGTEHMPQPREAARRIIAVLPQLRQLPTGSFADIRKIKLDVRRKN
ncbi:MAG: SDR family NAD(P)-dependent oxidoreductase [Verrucomicrobiota bacterium]